jgi:hypothetical protein
VDGRTVVMMGIDTVTYRARIGGFVVGRKMDSGIRVKGQNGMIKIWFFGLVVAVLLVIGGVEANPGPQVEQGKIDQILSYVKNQEKESKVIKQMVELHKQEMAETRKSTDALGLKFDRVSKIVTEIMNDYGQVKQVIKEWGKCYQRMEEKLRHLDEESRKNNIIIFGLQERGDESYLETMDMVVKFLCNKMRVEISR